jgi:hypothetical protein
MNLHRPLRVLPSALPPLALLLALVAVTSGAAGSEAIVMSYADAQRAISGLAAARGGTTVDVGPVRSEATWSSWVRAHVERTGNRVSRGEDDTILNWIMFGSSFSAHPPISVESLGRATAAQSRQNLFASRVTDLLDSLATPGEDERRRAALAWLTARGFRVDTDEGRRLLEGHLGREFDRVVGEWIAYRQQMDRASRLGGMESVLDAASRFFRDRGLSTDTSVLPGFAIEEALQSLKNQGLLRERSVRRVAVVGPGFDFADKWGGYDFYPPQSLQPFLLIDSLRRLGLVDPDSPLQVACLDVSPQVDEHLQTAVTLARQSRPYLLTLPLARRTAWNTAFGEYWRRAGLQVGSEAAEPARSVAADVAVRAITVRPEAVSLVTPHRLDIVVQQLSESRFDLIVATNVFPYYGAFEQALALANIDAMLAPGGGLLSNTLLPEVATLRTRLVSTRRVDYSTDDWDAVLWYQRRPE